MLLKNNIYKFLTLLLFISVFTGCASKYELAIQSDNKQWVKFGYSKEVVKRWRAYGFYTYYFAKPWLDVGITNPKEASIWKKYKMNPKYVKSWLDIGVTEPKEVIYWKNNKKEPSDIKPWLDLGFTKFTIISLWQDNGHNPSSARNWSNLGFESPELIKNIDYNDILIELKRQNISLEEYKLWLKFGLIQPDDIAYFKSKKYTTKTIKNKNAKDILNNMDIDTFFKFMGIKKERVKNFYIVHWKFNTNFKRFRDIVHRYYSI